MGTKVTALSTLAAPDIWDAVYVIDDPTGTPSSHKAGFAEFPLNAGQIYLDDGSGSQTLTTQNTWYKITQFGANGLSAATMTPDFSSNELTIDDGKLGIYKVSFQISFGGTGTETYEIALFLDNVIQPSCKCERVLGTGGDQGSASAFGLINVTSFSATLDLRARCTTGDSKVLECHYMQLIAEG